MVLLLVCEIYTSPLLNYPLVWLEGCWRFASLGDINIEVDSSLSCVSELCSPQSEFWASLIRGIWKRTDYFPLAYPRSTEEPVFNGICVVREMYGVFFIPGSSVMDDGCGRLTWVICTPKFLAEMSQ